MPIQAEITNINPNNYPSTDGSIDFIESQNSGAHMTNGPVPSDKDDQVDPFIKNATEFGINWAAGQIDSFGLISAAQFINNEVGILGSSGQDNNNVLPPDDQGDTGEGAFIQQTWNHKYYSNWECDQPYQGHYSTSALIEARFPLGNLPNDATLKISTKNVLGMYEEDAWGEDQLKDLTTGAETSLTIDIKNANFIDSNNFDASTPSTTFYTSEYTTNTYEDLHIHPEMSMIKIPENKDDDDAYYYAEIYTKDPSQGSDTDLFCTIEALQADTTTYDIFINEAIYWSDWESKDTDNNNRVEIPVEKIKVKAAQQYGGWEYTYQDTNEEWSFYMTNDGYGGGGGGGCPYISPWNGTKYKQENNLLVQSEFQNGEVTDYYKLDSDLQQKNGNYSMKIEEFENSEDYIDQMKLYMIDHKEGYKVGVTPEGEYITYKNSEAPLEAYNSTGDDVLNMVKEKNDDKWLEMDEGSEIILDYGDRSMGRWQFNKLILRSSGFSSHTEGSQSQIGILADKTSLYVSIKADGSEWKNVTVTHPRNNPHDSVIPLEDQLTDVLGKGHDLSDFKVKIESTKDHHIDYVGLDNSAPTPVQVQEADIQETIKTDSDGNMKYLNRSLTEDDNAVMHLVPGESCIVNFDVPLQIPGFEERDFIVMAKGFYTRYE